MQIWEKTTGYHSETAANIVLADSFFSVLIMRGLFSYGDIWADVELSSLWMFCKTWNLKWLWWNHRSYIFHNILSGTTVKQILPSFDIIILPKMLQKALLYILPSKLHTGTYIHYMRVVSLHITVWG